MYSNNSRKIESVEFWVKETFGQDSLHWEIETLTYGWIIYITDDLKRKTFLASHSNGKIYAIPATCSVKDLKNLHNDTELIAWQINNHILDVIDIIPPF